MVKWTIEDLENYEKLKQGRHSHFEFKNRAIVLGKLVQYETLIPGKLWLFSGTSGRYIVRHTPSDDGNVERNGNLVCECMSWRMSGRKRICKHTQALIKNGEIEFHDLVDLAQKREQLGQEMFGEV